MTAVAIVGTGYVGLTTGACVSHLGHDVICVDIDEAKIDRLSQGVIPIYEEGLQELVVEGLDAGTLRFTTDFERLADREIVFLCVPTPQREDGSADLSYVRQAAETIGPILGHDAIVVNKSTVPVGSTYVVEQAMQRTDALVVSNPEFLREGSAVSDFLQPDRIVIGADNQDTAIRSGSLYSKLSAPVIVTDPASAELIKYASNSFLAAKISFVNAIAAVSEAVGADVNDVVLGMGHDPESVLSSFDPAPVGVGAASRKTPRPGAHRCRRRLRLRAAAWCGGGQRSPVRPGDGQGPRRSWRGDLDDVLVAAWGLTFKARTDDLRDSPSLEIIRRAPSTAGRGFEATTRRPPPVRS